jgi:hypothetical protein
VSFLGVEAPLTLNQMPICAAVRRKPAKGVSLDKSDIATVGRTSNREHASNHGMIDGRVLVFDFLGLTSWIFALGGLLSGKRYVRRSVI